MSRPLIFAAVGSVLLATGVQAQPPRRGESPAISARIVGDMNACRAITGDAARLACFDRTVAAFEAARAGNQLRVIDRADIQKTKRSLFGLTLPRINLFGGGRDDGEPDIKEIDATIRTVRPMPHGLWIVVLDDGSQWQFTEEISVPFKAGDPIHIKSGSLGGYFGAVKKRSPQRIKRIG